MILKNGKNFPRDYLLEEARVKLDEQKKGIRRYTWVDPVSGARTAYGWEYNPELGRWRTEFLEHDPAYRAMQDACSDYDLTNAQDRIDFLALSTLCLFYDSWNFVGPLSQRVTANMGEVNRMDELEEFNRRLVLCERNLKEIQSISDDPDMAVVDAREAGTKAFREKSPARTPET